MTLSTRSLLFWIGLLLGIGAQTAYLVPGLTSWPDSWLLALNFVAFACCGSFLFGSASWKKTAVAMLGTGAVLIYLLWCAHHRVGGQRSVFVWADAALILAAAIVWVYLSPDEETASIDDLKADAARR